MKVSESCDLFTRYHMRTAQQTRVVGFVAEHSNSTRMNNIMFAQYSDKK